MNRQEAETKIKDLIDQSLDLRNSINRSELDLKLNEHEQTTRQLITEKIAYQMRLASVLEREAADIQSRIVDDAEEDDQHEQIKDDAGDDKDETKTIKEEKS